MSYRTDESALPTSSLDSGSDNSSHSVTSSSDQPLKVLYFLHNSWPFLDRFPNKPSFGNVDSWSFMHDRLEDQNSLGNINSWSFLDKHDEEQNSFGIGNSWDVSSKKEMMYNTRDVELNRSCASGHGESSKQSSPRYLQQSNRSLNSSGCSPDASTLYSYSGNHYNPSASGHRTSQELEDYIQWINGYLQYSVHDKYISDLTQSLADGQTLLYLVEELVGVTVTPIHVKPALQVQKTENIQMCLDVLKSYGVPVHDVTSQDIVKENAKIVLALCQSLRKHFGSLPGTPKTSPHGLHRSSSPSSVSRPLSREGHTTSTPNQSPRVAVIDMEDVAILQWVANTTNQPINGYESLQDGHVLCLLINELTGGAVPDVVLEYGLPSEKISLALTFSEEELGITTELHPEDVVDPTDTSKLSLYLQELHKIFLEQKQTDSEAAKVEKLVKQGQKLLERKEMELENAFIRGCDKEEVESAEKEDTKLYVSTENRLNPESSKDLKGIPKNEDHAQTTSVPRKYLDSDPGGEFPEKQNYYFLEEHKNAENYYKTSQNYYSGLYQSSYNTKPVKDSLDNSRKMFDGKLHHGIGDDQIADLLPRETMFDPANWDLPFKPLASKSWKKERERAKFKINHLNEQLNLLKEQYFKCMSIEIEKDNSDITEKNVKEKAYRSHDVSPARTDASPPKHAKSPFKAFSESFNSYFGKNKGTTPPYRTWSMYINTDGDRYKALSKKKREKVEEKTQLDSLGQSHGSTSTGNHSPKVCNRGHVNAPSNDVTRCREARKQESSTKEEWSLMSSAIKKIQETQSRDLTEKRSSDAGLSVCSTDSQATSGHRLYGITALVRLSSKKANAVSDNEN